MKKSLFLLLGLGTFFFSSTAAFPQERGMQPVQVAIEGKSTTLYSQSHALLIGVSAYNAGLPPLPGVVGDINTIKGALEGNGFNVVTVMNPDNIGLQKAFSNFIASYGKGINNRVLIYFAGHGYTQKMSYGDDIGYICPVDAPDPNKNPAGFQEKAMPMRQIETYAYQIDCKHALFLFDACFSGSIFSTSRAIPEVISYKTKEPVRQFITSGSANETVPDKSIFKDQFVRALKGEADGNKDGFLTGTELGEFLQSTVVNYSYGSQHPQYGKIRNANLDKGDFVFVLSPSTLNETLLLSQPASLSDMEKGTDSISSQNKKATLGIVPDFNNTKGKGLVVMDVRANSPAAIAGIISNDIIISMNGAPVKDIYSYMAELKKLRVGETVNLGIIRNSQTVNLIVQL